MRRRGLFFAAFFVFALIALLPLRLAIGWFALDGSGLAAREASGTLWAGALKEAQFGALPLGDLEARLNILPLFLGRARLSLRRDDEGGRFEGALSVSRHSFGLEDLDGGLAAAGLLPPPPLATLEFADLSVRFDNGQCAHAEGEVRAGLTGDAPTALSGAPRCEQGALLVPLDGGGGRLSLRFESDGRWRADLRAGAIVRQIEGSF